jgi:hypothetical protein
VLIDFAFFDWSGLSVGMMAFSIETGQARRITSLPDYTTGALGIELEPAEPNTRHAPGRRVEARWQAPVVLSKVAIEIAERPALMWRERCVERGMLVSIVHEVDRSTKTPAPS